MANRRFLQTLTRLHKTSLHSNPSLESLKTLKLKNPHFDTLITTSPNPNKIPHVFPNLNLNSGTNLTFSRHFSSKQRDDDGDENDEGEDDGEEEEGESDDDYDDDDEDEDVSVSNSGVAREYSLEERENEAAAIGYKVIGQLERTDRVFKAYEPVFAVVQIGSHQFKVSNGDCIYTEKLKFCEVNDKLTLNKVLMLGSTTQTMIGRPMLPDAAVHAIVEEHALDAKVIIFKKKRRKNYRRTKGHRQELTKLRITDIQGIEKPEMPTPAKTEKAAVKKVEKAAVAA